MNGLVGHSGAGGVGFANNTGEDNFAIFDLGSLLPVGGFDFFDRMVSDNKVTKFNMVFSEDDSFTTGVVTREYTGSTQSDEFAGINARM